MSLDISLYTSDTDGNEFEAWEKNITHNLTEMADKAGLYKVMWRPEEIEVKNAKEAVPYLITGIKYMLDNKEALEKLNPENGWGSYEGLLNAATEYYQECKKRPSARIEVSR